MHYQSIPIGVHVLKCITQQLNPLLPIFKNKFKEQEYLRQLISENNDIYSNSDFKKNSLHVHFMQCLMLNTLSFYGGVSIPCVKQFNYDEKGIELTWDSGIHDRFTFKNADEDFLNFAISFQNRLSTQKLHQKKIEPTIYRGIYQFLFSFKKILSECDKRFTNIQNQNYSLEEILEKNKSDDIIFLLISCLNSEDMNSLFISIQRFFPKIKITSKSGNHLNIQSLLEKNTSSLSYLQEKNSLYTELYYRHDLPEVKQITYQKTLEFIENIRKNTKKNNELVKNIQNCQNQQLRFRIKLLDPFIRFLEKVCD